MYHYIIIMEDLKKKKQVEIFQNDKLKKLKISFIVSNCYGIQRFLKLSNFPLQSLILLIFNSIFMQIIFADLENAKWSKTFMIL